MVHFYKASLLESVPRPPITISLVKWPLPNDHEYQIELAWLFTDHIWHVCDRTGFLPRMLFVSMSWKVSHRGPQTLSYGDLWMGWEMRLSGFNMGDEGAILGCLILDIPIQDWNQIILGFMQSGHCNWNTIQVSIKSDTKNKYAFWKPNVRLIETTQSMHTSIQRYCLGKTLTRFAIHLPMCFPS